jgi:hypothetical protein
VSEGRLERIESAWSDIKLQPERLREVKVVQLDRRMLIAMSLDDNPPIRNGEHANDTRRPLHLVATALVNLGVITALSSGGNEMKDGVAVVDESGKWRQIGRWKQDSFSPNHKT